MMSHKGIQKMLAKAILYIYQYICHICMLSLSKFVANCNNLVHVNVVKDV